MSGHGKGSEFERKIAKEIVKAFKSFGIEQRECWRSVLSGGHHMSAGDLRLSPRMEKLFPFCLEMKHRKRIRFENLFLEKTTEEKRWITQAIEGAKKIEGMTPVLVMKGTNNKSILALVGQRIEVHNNGPEIWIPQKGETQMWKLMPWKSFLKLAVVMAMGLKKAEKIDI